MNGKNEVFDQKPLFSYLFINILLIILVFNTVIINIIITTHLIRSSIYSIAGSFTIVWSEVLTDWA